MSSENSTTKQNILLDTCIIQYAIDKYSGREYRKLLNDIGKRGFILAISEFVVYELLQGAPVAKEAKLITWLNMFTKHPINVNVLIASARLKTLYDMERIPQSQIQDGDKIIAVTSILTGSPLLTANVNDFPRPFFLELERYQIIYQFKGHPRMIPTYILSPDYSVIMLRFDTRPK